MRITMLHIYYSCVVLCRKDMNKTKRVYLIKKKICTASYVYAFYFNPLLPCLVNSSHSFITPDSSMQNKSALFVPVNNWVLNCFKNLMNTTRKSILRRYFLVVTNMPKTNSSRWKWKILSECDHIKSLCVKPTYYQ